MVASSESPHSVGAVAAGFRALLAESCTQVVVATTTVGGRPHAATVSAFSFVSLDPPLVAVSVSRDALLLARLRASGRLGVNMLADGQQSIAARCGGSEDGKFADVPWTDADGLPRIIGAAGWLACEVFEEIAVGDHVLVVGHVIGAAITDQVPALLTDARRPFGGRADRPRIALSA